MTQLVYINDGRVVTDSLTVAEVFGKSHDHVIRDVKKQLQKLCEAGEGEWGVTNFGETTYQHPQNRQWYKKYDMTEDAFAIIAMSYTTPEAMKMKVRFLQEFKRMREQITFLTAPSYMIDDPIQRAQRWIVERQERDAIEAQRLLLEEKVTEQAERLTYLDEILQSQDVVCITQIAADYGLTAPQLNRILKDAGVQRKVGGQWVLTRKYLSQGYTKSHTFSIELEDGGKLVKMNTKWTQKGRLLIHEILTERGIEANRDRTLSA